MTAILIAYPEYTNPLWGMFLCDVAQILLTSLMNMVDESFMKWFYRLSSIYMLIVYLLFFTWLPAKVPKWQTGGIMTQWRDGTGASEHFGYDPAVPNGYVWLVALLFPAWTFYGYDASAHIAEETVGAAKTASRGMYSSVASAFVFSFGLLLMLLFAIQDVPGEDGVLVPYSGVDAIVAGYSLYPQPIAVIFISTMGEQGAVAFIILLFMVGFNCAVACAMSGRSPSTTSFFII
jgi:amino acid transporter